MSIRNLEKLFRPASIALVGSGRLMLVNPHHEGIGGEKVYPSVESLPQAPDLAVIATPPATVPSPRRRNRRGPSAD